jgi:hypothetical protein
MHKSDQPSVLYSVGGQSPIGALEENKSVKKTNSEISSYLQARRERSPETSAGAHANTPLVYLRGVRNAGKLVK